MSQSLRDLLRQGADLVERPHVDMDELVSSTERRLVHRRLTAVASSVAVVVLVAVGGLALQAADDPLAPRPSAPSETENTPGAPRELIFDEDESDDACDPGSAASRSLDGRRSAGSRGPARRRQLSCWAHEPLPQHVCRGSW